MKGRTKVDQYGDIIQSSSLPGDQWRKRNNQSQHVLYRLCLWRFSIISPAKSHKQGLAQIYKDRDRHDMKPILEQNFFGQEQKNTLQGLPFWILDGGTLISYWGFLQFILLVCMFDFKWYIATSQCNHNLKQYRLMKNGFAINSCTTHTVPLGCQEK